MNKVSVIMPAYKEKIEHFSQALNSLLDQTLKEIEIVIVVDNPDNSEIIEYVKAIKDSRVKLIVNKENIGIAKSLNKGLSVASGNFIARMDSDDISDIRRLEKQLKYLEENNLDLCGTNIKWFNDSGIVRNLKYPTLHRSIKKQIFKRNCLAHPTFFARKAVFDNLGGYHNIPSAEDYDFLLRAINKGYILGNVPEYLLLYRLNDESISRSNPGKQILISDYIRKFYSRNKSVDLTVEKIEEYLSSNDYRIKLFRYNRFYTKKNYLNKLKHENKIKYFLHLILLLFYFDLLVKNVYHTLYSRMLLVIYERECK